MQRALLAALVLVLAALPGRVGAEERGAFWQNERLQREAVRDEAAMRRRQEQMYGSGEMGRSRFTAEERQQLRRDIREHGRHVYRERRTRD